MPDPIDRIRNVVEARPDELWTLGQALRYTCDRNIAWARLAPPFSAEFNPTPEERRESQEALWGFWRDAAAGLVTSESEKPLWDLRADIAAGIARPDVQSHRPIPISPSKMTARTREAIFDLVRELATGRTARAILDYQEIRPSYWEEARLILSTLERFGEATDDFSQFTAEVERLMGDMLFPAVELIRAFSRNAMPATPNPPAEAAEAAEAAEPAGAAESKEDQAVAKLKQLYSKGMGRGHKDSNLLAQLSGEGLDISPATLHRALKKAGLTRRR